MRKESKHNTGTLDPLNNKWIGVKTVAKHFDMSIRGVWRAVARNDLAPPAKIGRCARWSLADVQDFERMLLEQRGKAEPGATT